MPLVLPSPALCTPLVSVADFKAFVTIDDTVDDAVIERVLCAATAWIESPEGCGRSFTLDTSDVTRTYWPYDSGRVLVDDLVSVTSIALDTTGNRTFATTLATTDYLLWPLTGPPYQEIRSWPGGANRIVKNQMVRVVGRNGFVNAAGLAPASIQQACLLLSNRWFARRQSPFGVLEIPATGHFQRIATEDPDVQTLLLPYVRTAAGWVLV